MFTTLFPRRCAFIITLGLGSLGGGAANAQTCVINAPRYSLQEEIVNWSMPLASGRSCVHGVRFDAVQFNSLTLLSPPRFGGVEVQGAAFVYSAKAGFHGHDEFTLVVVGAINGRPGSSTIRVTVSVGSGSGTPEDAASSSLSNFAAERRPGS